MRPFLPAFGITRVGRVTGLDCIGIPVFIAVRPNGRSFSVTQGKGLNDDAAEASAIMEAVEQAIAERPEVSLINVSLTDLQDAGEAIVRPARFLKAEAAFDPAEPIDWVAGWDLIEEKRTWVPFDALILDFAENSPRSPHPFYQSSDGLASGNLLLEAILHGLYERIERDSATLWSYCTVEAIADRSVDPEAFSDVEMSGLAALMAAAGVRLRLFDITSDLGIPTYFALLADVATDGQGRRLEVCRGSGCHPIPVRAAIRAVTEAAQSRLTGISAARDDFGPELYAAKIDPRLTQLMTATPGRLRIDLSQGGSVDAGDQLSEVVRRFKKHGIRSAVAVPLGGEPFGIAVVKMVIPDLEDPPDIPHRVLGRRALNAMLGQVS
jgi:ribosomal protein S12 methylthiotransferase accessory factor